MKAATYHRTGGPEVLRYEEVPDPPLRRGGVLIEVKAIGIQGGDLLNRQSGRMPATPHVVGYQAAGVVREVGEGVDGLQPGQRVVAFMDHGSHAELASVRARSVWPLPDGLSFEVAAGIPVEFGTAHDCLFEFWQLQPDDVVLVHAAAGGVGLAAVQLAARAGATVLAAASSDARVARLAPFGAHHGINSSTADVVAEVQRLTEGRGVDLVVDPVGGTTLERSVAALAYRGRISWVGSAGREGVVPDVRGLMLKSARLQGVFLGGEMAHDPERTGRMIADLIARVAAGELQVVVDRTFPLSEAAEAHRYIESRQAFGRVVLVP